MTTTIDPHVDPGRALDGHAVTGAAPTSTSGIRKRFVAVALVLAALGCFAVVVGSHDVYAAHGLGTRLFGAFLAAAGLIMMIAALGVFRRATWHVALSLVGSFAAFLVGIALLIAQVEAARSGTMVALWAGVVVASLLALVLSLGPGAPQVSSAVRRVQLVAVGGMLLGVSQFVYTSVYGASPSGPHVRIVTTLQRIGDLPMKNGLIPAKARITITNTSERKVVVVDSVYTVTGGRVLKWPRENTDYVDNLEQAVKADWPGQRDIASVRGAGEDVPVVVRAGQILERRYTFEPREMLTREFIVYTAAGRFDLLRLSANLVIAESGVLELGDEPVSGPTTVPRRYAFPGHVSNFTLLETKWNVRETSWVHRLVRGQNVLTSRWTLATDGVPSPDMAAWIDKKGSTVDPWNEGDDMSAVTRLSDEYGLLETYGQASLALLPPRPA